MGKRSTIVCTSLKVETGFATGKGVGLESFSKSLRIRREYFEFVGFNFEVKAQFTTGRDDLGIFSKFNSNFETWRSCEVANVDDLDEP